MKLTLGFSPCPNDTFIFDALVNGKIDTQGIDFDTRLEDVQTLNHLALQGALDITKISYGVLPLVLRHYLVFNSGGALGSGVGPLLISKNEIPPNEIENCIVAIPGENTTAHMLFTLAFPQAKNKIFLRYDQIEDFVLDSSKFRGTVGDFERSAGVIIHENRFTYHLKGLKKIMDLGDFWQNKTGAPIPLGAIVGKRDLDPSLLKKVDRLIKQSIEYGFKRYPELTNYIRDNSRELEEDVMRKHIELYVNDYSLSLGEEGINAVIEFLKIYEIANPSYRLFDGQVFL